MLDATFAGRTARRGGPAAARCPTSRTSSEAAAAPAPPPQPPGTRPGSPPTGLQGSSSLYCRARLAGQPAAAVQRGGVASEAARPRGQRAAPTHPGRCPEGWARCWGLPPAVPPLAGAPPARAAACWAAAALQEGRPLHAGSKRRSTCALSFLLLFSLFPTFLITPGRPRFAPLITTILLHGVRICCEGATKHSNLSYAFQRQRILKSCSPVLRAGLGILAPF